MKKINNYTLTKARLFKANLGNSNTFKDLNSENKIQAHFKVLNAPPPTTPANSTITFIYADFYIASCRVIEFS